MNIMERVISKNGINVLNIREDYPVISPEKDKLFRKELGTNFSEYIVGLIEALNSGSEICTEDFMFSLGSLNVDFSVKPYKKSYDSFGRGFTTLTNSKSSGLQEDFTGIKDVIATCTSNLILIPTKLRFFTLPKPTLPIPEDYVVAGHQALLIINKSKKTILFVDPDDSSNTIYDISEYIQNYFKDYSVESLPITCLQALAKDDNCMFWTFLVVTLIILNNDMELKDILKKFTEIYPGDKVGKYIEQFKSFVFSEETDSETPKGGKRKWAISTVRRRTFRKSKMKRSRFMKKSLSLKRKRSQLKH